MKKIVLLLMLAAAFLDRAKGQTIYAAPTMVPVQMIGILYDATNTAQLLADIGATPVALGLTNNNSGAVQLTNSANNLSGTFTNVGGIYLAGGIGGGHSVIDPSGAFYPGGASFSQISAGGSYFYGPNAPGGSHLSLINSSGQWTDPYGNLLFDIANTNWFFTGNATTTKTNTAARFVGPLTGNADTATSAATVPATGVTAGALAATVTITSNNLSGTLNAAQVDKQTNGASFYGTNVVTGISGANHISVTFVTNQTGILPTITDSTQTNAALNKLGQGVTDGLSQVPGATNATTATNLANITGLPSGNLPSGVKSSSGNTLLDTSSTIPSTSVSGLGSLAAKNTNDVLNLTNASNTYGGNLTGGVNVPSVTAAQFAVFDSGKNLISTLDGSSLLTLNASHIGSGTVPSGAMPVNIASATNATTATNLSSLVGLPAGNLPSGVKSSAGNTLLDTASTIPSTSISGLGNAAIADTNVVKVFASTNADKSTTYGSFGNSSIGNTNVMKVFASTNADAVPATGIMAGAIPSTATVTSNNVSGQINLGQIAFAGNAAKGDTNVMKVNSATNADNFTGSLAGDVTGTQSATVVGAGIARLGGTNAWTGTNNFSGTVNIGTAVVTNISGNGGGLTNLNAVTIYNDSYAATTPSYNPPLNSCDWAGADLAYIPSYHNGEYWFNEAGGAAYLNFTLIAMPETATNCTLTWSARSLSGGSDGCQVAIWNRAFTQVIATNAAVNVASSNYSLSFPCSPNFGGRNDWGIMIGNGSAGNMAISNMALSFLPATTDPVLSAPFVRYNISQKNLQDNAGMNGKVSVYNPYVASQPDYSILSASTHSILDIQTDAKMFVAETFFSQQTSLIDVQIDSPAGFIDYTNITSNGGTNGNFMHLEPTVYLPAGKAVSTVRFINLHANQTSGYGLRALYVPATNSVKFLKTDGYIKTFAVIGDSIISGVNVKSNYLNDTIHIIETAYPFKFVNLAVSGRQLYDYWTFTNSAYNVSMDALDQFRSVNPDNAIVALGFNDWNATTYGAISAQPTNAFLSAYTNMLNEFHQQKPACVFFNISPIVTTFTTAATNTIQDYRNMVLVASTVCTNWCQYIDGSGITVPLFDNIHPTSGGAVLYGNKLRAQILMKRMHVLPAALSGDAGGLTNIPASQLTGSVADARLSANVALLNAANAFTANQSINGALVVTNITPAAAHTNIMATLPSGIQVAVDLASAAGAGGGGGGSGNASTNNAATQIWSGAQDLTNSANRLSGSVLYLGTGTSWFMGGGNASEVSVLATNSNSASSVSVGASADNGTAITNYVRLRENNSSYVMSSTAVGTTNSAVLEFNGGDLLLAGVGGAPHFRFGSRLSPALGFVTNIFDLSLTSANFKENVQVLSGTTVQAILGGTSLSVGAGGASTGARFIGVTTRLFEAGTATFRLEGGSGGDAGTLLASNVTSQFSIATNGYTSFVSNAVPVTTFTIAISANTFWTNTAPFSVLVGFTATTVTGVGLSGTNGGAGGQFQQWMIPLTGGCVPVRSQATVAFTNGVAAGTGSWTPFP